MSDQKPNFDTVVIGSFDLTLQLPNGNSGAHNPNMVQFHGYIYGEDTEADITSRLAMFQRAGECEQARLAVPVLEHHVKAIYDDMMNNKKILDGLVELQRNPTTSKRMTSQQKSHLEQLPAVLIQKEETLKKANDELLKAKAKAGIRDGG